MFNRPVCYHRCSTALPLEIIIIRQTKRYYYTLVAISDGHRYECNRKQWSKCCVRFVDNTATGSFGFELVEHREIPSQSPVDGICNVCLTPTRDYTQRTVCETNTFMINSWSNVVCAASRTSAIIRNNFQNI